MACDKAPKTNTSGNSYPAKTQSTPSQSQSSGTASVSGENIPGAIPPYATPNPSASADLNPPHGQPGHRCDIAVGVPLDSPPGTGKTTTPVNPQLNSMTQTAPAPSTAPGMNPPHGQPNHRCDIAVGVPLDSPPGTGKTPSAPGASPSTSSPPIKIVPSPK